MHRRKTTHQVYNASYMSHHEADRDAIDAPVAASDPGSTGIVALAFGRGGQKTPPAVSVPR